MSCPLRWKVSCGSAHQESYDRSGNGIQHGLERRPVPVVLDSTFFHALIVSTEFSFEFLSLTYLMWILMSQRDSDERNQAILFVES